MPHCLVKRNNNKEQTVTLIYWKEEEEGGVRNGEGCGESKHERHLRMDVSASVSARVSGCRAGRGGNGSLNGICFISGSVYQE